ncbi:unnamed protein product [Adineta ricciae]|nr:unnamed protein product [Adineta ricciae]
MAIVSLLYLIQLYRILATPHFNLHHTDWTNEDEISETLQHDCLYVPAIAEKGIKSYQTISYCLTQWPSKWNVSGNVHGQNFTFAELYERDITSEQLYLWSGSIKLIEDYQNYRDQRSTNFQEIVSSYSIFYNCTMPNFGSQCQYSLETYQPYHQSLTDLVREFYRMPYAPTSRTCYIHLECNRGSTSICLGWYEICDGIVDCFNDEIDEKYCWQMKLDVCQENEYRCKNGQCISQEFFQDHVHTVECLDESDQSYQSGFIQFFFDSYEPTFFNEDIQFIRYKDSRSYGDGMSSSVLSHIKLLKADIFMETPKFVSNNCWLAFKCHYNLPNRLGSACMIDRLNKSFLNVINMTCPEQFVIPATPIAFRHIYFLYLKDQIFESNYTVTPPYICYDQQYCDEFLPNRTLISFNNLTCRKPEDFPLSFADEDKKQDIDYHISEIYKQLYRCNTIFYNDTAVCHQSIMYTCRNSSKCIYQDQLDDGIVDCNYHDDEQYSVVNSTCWKGQFKCLSTKKCISIDLLNNGNCDCGLSNLFTCEHEEYVFDAEKDFLLFSFICDGYTQVKPLLINNRTETDETDCDYWQCNNTYTRCNQRWNCWNGADEINCNSNSICPSNHHQCVSLETYQLMCLPLAQANDGQIDCVGATDEPKFCRLSQPVPTKNFLCANQTNSTCIESHRLCSQGNRCANHVDEKLCSSFQTNSMCDIEYSNNRTDVHEFFCQRYIDGLNTQLQAFKPHDLQFPKREQHFPIFPIVPVYDQRCHRGLPIKVRSSIPACLCPPSYYGDTCQYDRQRVSLTLQFQAHSDSRRTLFTFLISLIDHERTIYSYEQYTYFYPHDCTMKYNTYLLHPVIPKNYSIHIDVYEKTSLTYRGSFSIPIRHLFLPVNRIATRLIIPPSKFLIKACAQHACQNGKCRYYVNGRTFCRCDLGWTGESCSIRYSCQCASDSICAGVTANNQSVCICPVNRWGARCLLQSNVCQLKNNDLCLNGGQCVSIDQQFQPSRTYFCVCRKGFHGDRCEETDPYFKLSFQRDIILPQSIITHFIDANNWNSHLVAVHSIVQRISLYQRDIIVYPTTNKFDIVFVQLLTKYYLARVLHRSNNIVTSHNQTIYPSYRCKHISELFNQTILAYHQLRRLKYYQLPCEKYSPELRCFYDDDYFCLCYDFNQKRLSNCFNFQSKVRRNCYELSDCENGAECIQDKFHCPERSMCLCQECFHGTRCQFSSQLFGISLDATLGYHIQSQVKLTSQPFVVQLSLALTILLVVLGILNGILSLLTFKNEELRKTACGFYLLGSSITSLSIMVVFLLKFSILLNAQMTYMTNESFLKFQCYTLDFLLRISLSMDQYLNGCVATERAVIAYRGVHFNKKKSQRLAKYIILCLLFWTAITTIHDPIHRHLLYDNSYDDDVENRIWCIVSYSKNVRIFNSVINLVHFFVPFILNSSSAFVIIICTSLKRRKMQHRVTYRRILQEQFQEHLHLLIAPIVLVLLALPRLILSFIFNCMASSHDVWLPLIGHFISFIPPLLTFIIFIMPSKLYMKEFDKSIRKIRTALQSCVA